MGDSDFYFWCVVFGSPLLVLSASFLPMRTLSRGLVIGAAIIAFLLIWLPALRWLGPTLVFVALVLAAVDRLVMRRRSV
ncbi:hypothetical protein LX15_004328 [Streptoalloteichus tenebrarius]|uniref:Uncharacterized protein n=1 Tax=Streptoalloteichus tenebrarius (strain ATCC 17920 / DSM 40477 / JCM 4838 / CBS 697.72 / NBRC 16177 / NCIMB 11028 / NRRL B-12390 / A12253. 1 / ISP 5477) TaxID=1933 RepID=A0ABT1HYK2_STRSD|nr:hypothetical protein [Streptoalloteichus tenebrarius]